MTLYTAAKITSSNFDWVKIKQSGRAKILHLHTYLLLPSLACIHTYTPIDNSLHDKMLIGACENSINTVGRGHGWWRKGWIVCAKGYLHTLQRMLCMYMMYDDVLLSLHRLHGSLQWCRPPSPRGGSRRLHGHYGLPCVMRSSHTNITDTQNEIGQVRDTQRCMNVSCMYVIYVSLHCLPYLWLWGQLPSPRGGSRCHGGHGRLQIVMQ